MILQYVTVPITSAISLLNSSMTSFTIFSATTLDSLGKNLGPYALEKAGERLFCGSIEKRDHF